MKRMKWVLWSVWTSVLLVSCIQQEAPNAECDILRATLQVENIHEIFKDEADATVQVASDVSQILFFVTEEADLSALSPEFVLTPGATIVPESGSTHDFTKNAISYEVTSEDGAWKRQYAVKFTTSRFLSTDLTHFSLNSTKKYYQWFDVQEGDTLYNWATGNPGYALSKSSAKPDEYPTIPYALSPGDTIVKLTTRDTGAFGAMVNMRLAAGNLFLGSFDVSSALSDAMKATQFGVPFNKMPLRLKGWYQYTPGQVYQDRLGKPVEGSIDTPDIYAVLYCNRDEEGNEVVLHGDDVLTHRNIVALARLSSYNLTGTWTPFDLAFNYNQSMPFDPSFVRLYNYNIAIVFSSSIDGAQFCGAVGSELLIKDIELICANTQ